MNDTIYALSSGGLPSGIAVIRISGKKSRVVVETICENVHFGSAVSLSKIFNPSSRKVVDEGLILTFVAPNSFTGEDVAEFQVHGGRAIVDAIFELLGEMSGLRHAEAGEFTYRAFENGKVDLTQAEGIADLIASETESQRALAFDAVEGKSKKIVENWLEQLTALRALIEAEIDFVDEEDIPGSVSDQVWMNVENLVSEFDQYIESYNVGEIVRNGFRVTLLGKPNAGKSTLLNSLAGRDVAIVSDIPGTTRDVLEVRLNLGGQVVIIRDTAGIHVTIDNIEKEGISRAIGAAEDSDMKIWLHPADDGIMVEDDTIVPDLLILSKKDKLGKTAQECSLAEFDLAISVLEDDGVNDLVDLISDAARNCVRGDNDLLFSRERHRNALQLSRNAMVESLNGRSQPLEIRAEHMRVASDSLGKLVGRVDVEDVLGVIFSEFCVGK